MYAIDDQDSPVQAKAPSSRLCLEMLASTLALVIHIIVDFITNRQSGTKPVTLTQPLISDWFMDGMVRHVCTRKSTRDDHLVCPHTAQT